MAEQQGCAADDATTGRVAQCLMVFLGQPINRLLVTAFTLVALLLLAFLSWHLHDMAWRDAWREIDEKHRLLAENMVAPIQIYVRAHTHSLSLLGDGLASASGDQGQLIAPEGRRLVEDLERNPNGFRTLSLLSAEGAVLHSSLHQSLDSGLAGRLARQQSYRHALATGRPQLAGIAPSPYDGQPSLMMAQPLTGPDGSVTAVLLGELSVDPIEALRASIHFGKRGHSTIVDQHGRVIAHPNPEWMREIKDLSGLSIIRQTLTGQTGVTEFHSPFVKEDMVAGFTSVPDIGWGIIVPQPKSEVAERVGRMLFNQLSWVLVGLALAVLLSVVMANWITGPLKRLARTARGLVAEPESAVFPGPERHAPREVQELSHSFGTLVSSLNRSYRHIDDLNRDLQHKVSTATEELRIANSRLSTLAAEDHLTGLANRRQFEAVLEKRLRACRASDGPLTLMLVDVDDFKRINDRHGHAAGDAVLVWIAQLLKAATREVDLLARYAGDEFVLCMACGIDQARVKADWLVRRVAEQAFAWEGAEITVTVSVGINEYTEPGMALDNWFPRVDQAMYRAKQAGRNQVAF